MAHVFQYGSNTSATRLNSDDRLRGDARALCATQTQADFELDFDVWSKKNNCAASDIVAGNGRKIWGVLYEVPDYLITSKTSGQRKSLDAIEGPKYKRISIALNHSDGTPVYDSVITYVVVEIHRQTNIQTSLDYCRHIIAGLRDYSNFVPEEYLQYAKGRMISNNPALRDGVLAL
jgi:hypothetical protein